MEPRNTVIVGHSPVIGQLYYQGARLRAVLFYYYYWDHSVNIPVFHYY